MLLLIVANVIFNIFYGLYETIKSCIGFRFSNVFLDRPFNFPSWVCGHCSCSEHVC